MKLGMGPIATSAEERVANLLRALEGDKGDAAGAARWLARNWLRTRGRVVEAAKLTPDADVQRVLAEALEVDDAV